jgi:hypothetical protein
MKLLVGILYAGEQEYDRCVSALSRQINVDADHFVIQDKPNKAAHDALYVRFMDQKDAYSHFVKLDADMVLTDTTALRRLLSLFDAEDVAAVGNYVFDAPSGIAIPIIHAFRSDVTWTLNADPLAVDYRPNLPGRAVKRLKPDIVDHMPDPSPFQLFRYGVHKALKSLQPDRERKDSAKAILHAVILDGMARNFRGGRKDLRWALIGAMLVYDRKFNNLDYNSPAARDLFEYVGADERRAAEFETRAEKYWAHEVENMLRWLRLYQQPPYL